MKSIISITVGTLLFCFTAGVFPAQGQDDFQMDTDIQFDMGDEFEGFDEADFGAPVMSEEEIAAAQAMGAVVFFGAIAACFLGLLLTALVAYLMMDALNAVPKSFRQLSPMVPWLLFVPLVNIVILFLVFIKVPESLNAYLQSTGDTSQGDCGKSMGLWGSILYILGCTFPIGLVMLILAILKINGAKKVARASAAAA